MSGVSCLYEKKVTFDIILNLHDGNQIIFKMLPRVVLPEVPWKFEYMYTYYFIYLTNNVSLFLTIVKKLKLPLKRMNCDFHWLTDMQVVKGLYH